MGIDVENNEVIFNPFSDEEFEVNDVVINGRKYSFIQQVNGEKKEQKIIINYRGEK